MRDYLHAESVEFDDRNIRQSEDARQGLQSLTGNLIVPVLMYGDDRVTGFDPDGLAQIASSYHAANAAGVR